MRTLSIGGGLAIWVAGLSIFIFASPGCAVQKSGEQGNLIFTYEQSALAGVQGDGDLAVGARVDITVRDGRNDEDRHSGGPTLELIDVYSEDELSIAVTEVGDEIFTVEAIAESESAGTRVFAEALDTDGEPLVDALSIRSAVVAEIEFRACSEDAVYLTDSEGRFTYRMKDEQGQRLTGYGYYPVVVEPPTGGTVIDDTRRLETLRISTGDEPGVFDLLSDVGDNSLSFELIDRSDIDALELVDVEEEPSDEITVGGEELIAAFTLSSRNRVVCGPSEKFLEVSAETPEYCEPVHGELFDAVHLVGVEARAAGTCRITVGVAGADLEESFSVEIREKTD